MASISIGYSTGDLESTWMQQMQDGKPAFGLKSLGGKMARVFPFQGYNTYTLSINGENGDARNRIWSDIKPIDFFENKYTYRCLYLRVDSGVLINPKVYITSNSNIEYDINFAKEKNIECQHLISDETIEPNDINSHGQWKLANSYNSGFYILEYNKPMIAGEFIYFWVRRRLNNGENSEFKILEKFSVCVSTEE